MVKFGSLDLIIVVESSFSVIMLIMSARMGEDLSLIVIKLINYSIYCS